MPEEENARDGLTQLLNRRGVCALAERLDSSWDRVFGVLAIDIDHLIALNMEHGHGFGDVVLVEFANRLTEAVGGDGEVFRIGGDEFLAVLPNSTLDTASAFAERVCARIRTEPFELPDGRTWALTTSIGVACAPWHGATLDTVLDAADRAMYQSKISGRDQWTLATS
jgi:two-component system, cell cycle response regulator